MKALIVIAALLPSLASAHCDPSQIAGRWSARASGAQAFSSGFVQFFADQTVAADLIGSASGSSIDPIDFPAGNYPLTWAESSASDSGVCTISATFTASGVSQTWVLRYPGGTRPKSISGVGSIARPGKPLTMQVVLQQDR